MDFGNKHFAKALPGWQNNDFRCVKKEESNGKDKVFDCG